MSTLSEKITALKNSTTAGSITPAVVGSILDDLAAIDPKYASQISQLAAKINTINGTNSSTYIDTLQEIKDFLSNVPQSSRMSTYIGNITSLLSRVSTLETAKTDHASRISSLESNMTSAKSDLSTAKSDITSLKTRTTNVEGRASSLESRASQLEDVVDSNGTQINDLQEVSSQMSTKLNNVSTKAETALSTANEAKSTASAAQSTADNINIQRGRANGFAPLDAAARVPDSVMPAASDDVVEFAGVVTSLTGISQSSSEASFSSKDSAAVVKYYLPLKSFIIIKNSTAYRNWTDAGYFGQVGPTGTVPVAGKLYVDTATDSLYRWDGNLLHQIPTGSADVKESVQTLLSLAQRNYDSVNATNIMEIKPGDVIDEQVTDADGNVERRYGVVMMATQTKGSTANQNMADIYVSSGAYLMIWRLRSRKVSFERQKLVTGDADSFLPNTWNEVTIDNIGQVKPGDIIYRKGETMYPEIVTHNENGRTVLSTNGDQSFMYIKGATEIFYGENLRGISNIDLGMVSQSTFRLAQPMDRFANDRVLYKIMPVPATGGEAEMLVLSDMKLTLYTMGDDGVVKVKNSWLLIREHNIYNTTRNGYDFDWSKAKEGDMFPDGMLIKQATGVPSKKNADGSYPSGSVMMLGDGCIYKREWQNGGLKIYKAKLEDALDLKLSAVLYPPVVSSDPSPADGPGEM